MSDSHYAVDATNRLSIAHLLLWMATTSAVLAFLQAWDVPYGPLDSSESDTEFKFASFHQTKRIMNRMIAPAYGVALAAGVLTTWRAVMQWPGFPTHPGHWMLLVVCMWAATIATTVSVADLLRVSFSLEGTIFAALMLANATVAGIGAFRATRQGTELWVFPLLALTFVAGTMAVCGIVVACSDPPSAPPMLPLFVLGFGALLVAAITMFTAACIDLWRRRPRDVFHWAGVICVALIIVHPLSEWIAKRLILP